MFKKDSLVEDKLAAYQQQLFAETPDSGLPTEFVPRVPEHFVVERIILARGSVSEPSREAFVRMVCAAFPDVGVEEQLNVPHNRIDLGERDPWRLHERGKRTLVFGELKNAVRFSEEAGNTCPNYWHFSVYGACPYRCSYCYLAGTQGVFYSPSVKVFVNLGEIMGMIDRTANRLGVETGFYHGKLQDGLALDPLTSYSSVLIPFFARHPLARHVVLTKSASVEQLLNLEHNGHTVLSWSLNPPGIAAQYERNVPTVEQRMRAMERCAAAGYPVRAVLMPLIPETGWEDVYGEFLTELLARVPIQRLTLGGVCSYGRAESLMEHHVGRGNAISRHFEPRKSLDGRRRYPAALRVRLYRVLAELARQLRPETTVSLCMEEAEVWKELERERVVADVCNCVF